MSAAPDNEKLERLLHGWADARAGRLTDACLTIPQAAAAAERGPADEAQAAHLAACPACARLVGRLEALPREDSPAAPAPRRAALRWAPLAAGLVLAAAGAATLLLPSYAARRATGLLRDAPTPDPVQASATAPALPEPTEAEQRLAAAERRAQTLAAQGAQASDDLAAAHRRLEELQAQIQATAGTAEQLEAARRELAAARDAAAQAEAGVAELDQAAAAERAAFLAELARRRGAWQLLLAQRGPVQMDAGLLAALQSVARAQGLAQRSARLAERAGDAELRELLAQIEAAVTRLDLADARDPFEQQWLAELIAGDLPGRIDAVLAADEAAIADARPRLDAEIRALLVDAHTLLLGGASAG